MTVLLFSCNFCDERNSDWHDSAVICDEFDYLTVSHFITPGAKSCATRVKSSNAKCSDKTGARVGGPASW